MVCLFSPTTKFTEITEPKELLFQKIPRLYRQWKISFFLFVGIF